MIFFLRFFHKIANKMIILLVKFLLGYSGSFDTRDQVESNWLGVDSVMK